MQRPETAEAETACYKMGKWSGRDRRVKEVERGTYSSEETWVLFCSNRESCSTLETDSSWFDRLESA